jgi:hypothetical protein
VTFENIVMGGMTLIAVASVLLAHQLGYPQKWDAAVYGTVVPFGSIIVLFRDKLKRKAFWQVYSICIAIHFVLFWVIFEMLFSRTQRFGIVFMLPTMFAETFILLGLVSRFERQLSKHRGQ